jgi:D-alanine-D-alanine ligase
MLRVGVLRGGPSSEYDISLITGASVLKHLSADKYKAKDILVSKDGVWHIDGLPAGIDKIARHIDVIFNATHGKYGEDGKVQAELDHFGVPYTGSRAAPSAVAFNKVLAKQVFERYGIKTPKGEVVDDSAKDDIQNVSLRIFRKISPPWFVKPVNGGSSVGTTLVRNVHDLPAAILLALEHDSLAMVEECIKGREATCGVINNFRGKKLYSLLPIEIVKPDDKDFFDRQCKYDGTSKEICPGNFTATESKEIQRLAMEIHSSIGLDHYSRSDFIVSPRGIYALEVNTLPGLTPESLMPKALAAVGCSYPDFLDHLITLALNKK